MYITSEVPTKPANPLSHQLIHTMLARLDKNLRVIFSTNKMVPYFFGEMGYETSFQWFGIKNSKLDDVNFHLPERATLTLNNEDGTAYIWWDGKMNVEKTKILIVSDLSIIDLTDANNLELFTWFDTRLSRFMEKWISLTQEVAINPKFKIWTLDSDKN